MSADDDRPPGPSTPTFPAPGDGGAEPLTTPVGVVDLGSGEGSSPSDIETAVEPASSDDPSAASAFALDEVAVQEELAQWAVEPTEQTSLTQLLLDFGLFLALFVTPWLISVELKEVFNTTKNAFIGYVAIMMAMVYVAEASGKREVVFPRLRTIPYLLVLLGWMAISLIWGGSFDLAIRDFGYHLAIYTIFLITLITVWDRDRMENLIHFAIAAGVIVAGYATLQYYGLDEKVFNALSNALFWEDPSRLDPGTGQSLHGGVLSALFSQDTARIVHAYIDPRFLILPGKPEEPSKNYSFMGHRNYLAGYLIALIPLILSRLLAHLDVLLKRIDQAASEANAEPFFSEVERKVLIAGALVVVGAWVGASEVPRLWPLGVVSTGLWLLVLSVISPLARSVIVYLASLLLLFTTVLQTHTRGSWIGLAIALPFFYFTIYIKESGMGQAEWVRFWNRVGIILVACLLKVLVLKPVSWLILFAVLAESVVNLLYVNFRPKYLHRKALILTIAPFVLSFMVLNWKSVEIPGLGTFHNNLNKEWTSALDRLDDTFRFGEATSTHQRMLIYRTTLEIIFDSLHNVLIGTGIGTFGLHYMPYQARVLTYPQWQDYVTEVNKSIYAHDEYMHYWSEIGLVGLVLFLAVTMATFFACQRSLWACPVNYENLLFIGILSALLAVMGHIFFSFCLHLAYTAVLFFVLVAFAMRFFPCRLRRIGLNPCAESSGRSGDLDYHLSLRRTGDGQVRALVRLAAPHRRAFDQNAPVVLSLIDPQGRRQDTKGPPSPHSTLAVGSDEVLVSDMAIESPEMDGLWSARLLHEGKPAANPSIEVQRPGRQLQVLTMLVTVIVATVLCIRISEILVSEHNWRNGFLKFRQGKFVDSFLDFTKAAQHDPGKGEIYFDFGRALMDSGRNKLAIEVFKRATENFVDPANYHNIALCYYKEHDIDNAEKSYRESLRLNLIYEQSLSNLAFLLLDKERPPAEMAGILDEAGHLAFLGVRYYRTNTSFWTALGVVRAKQERFDESLVYLMGSLSQNLVDRARRLLNDQTAGDRELRMLLLVRTLVDSDAAAQRAALEDLPHRLKVPGDEGLRLEQKAAAELTLILSQDDAAHRADRIKALESRISALQEKAHGGSLATENIKEFGALVDSTTEKLRAGMVAAIVEKPSEDQIHTAIQSFLFVEQALDRIPEVELDAAADKVRLNVATIWQSRKETGQALLLLSRIAAKDDPAARARYLSVLTSHYDGLLRPHPDDQGLLLELARAFEAWNFHSEAAKTLYHLLDVAPQNVDALTLISECLYKQHYIAQAVKELDKARVLLPATDPRARSVSERLAAIQAEQAREATHPTTR